jgi:hypothetical protein
MNTNQMSFDFDSNPTTTCERCDVDEARHLVEHSNGQGEAVCSGCLAHEAWLESLKTRGFAPFANWVARGNTEAWRYNERGE